MSDKMKDSEKVSSLPNQNPLRERLTHIDAADFSSATLRRVSLAHLGRFRQ